MGTLAPGRARSTVHFWASCILLSGFVSLAVAYVRSEKRVQEAYESRHRSDLLADELRRSSDDLTRMARTHVATGDPRYQRHYEEILAIREGRSLRPLDAHDVYWDLVLSDDRRPRPGGVAVPLLTLMRQAGFTETELDMLGKAKAASDALTKVEFAAMALVEGGSAARRPEALALIHDAAYHEAKAGIMGPISAVHAMVDARTAATLSSARTFQTCLRWLLGGVGLALGLSLWRLLAALVREQREKAGSEAIFRAVFDNATVGLAQFSMDGRYLNVNQALCDIVGYSKEELVEGGRSYQEITLPEDLAGDQASVERMVQGDPSVYPRIKRYRHKDGRVVWASVFANLIRLPSGEPQSFISAVVDITRQREIEAELERHRAQLEQLVEDRTAELQSRNERLAREIAGHEQAIEALMESEGRFRFIAENSFDVIWTLDLASRRFTYMSPSVQRLRGYTAEEVMARPFEDALAPESAERVEGILQEVLERWNRGEHSDVAHVVEVEQPHKDGRIIQTEVVATVHGDAEGRPSSILGVSRDITERKHREDLIRHLAFFDALTELPNRRFLLDRLQEAIARARRDHSRIALLFIDLDRFKPINDELGHEVGDWLLRAVARRIESCLREYDTAARLGGDEFIVLLPGLVLPDESLVIAERVRAALEQPFLTEDGRRLEISSSIGVALFPDHAGNERDLLRLGDEAMYRAKSEGRNRVALLAMAAPVLPGAGAFFCLAWGPTLVCGNETIDAEHRELFQLGNRLLDSVLGPEADPSALPTAVDALLAHVTTHFQHEEAILRERGYARLEQHSALHRALLLQASALRERLRTGGPVGEVIDFLVLDVVSKHLLNADRDFFPLFAQTR